MDVGSQKILAGLWAKTAGVSWHPLILHMLDVAACADAVLAREPESSRVIAASILGMSWEDARNGLLFLIASHDVGKACPGFQCKWPHILDTTGLTTPLSPNTDINHAFVSQIAVSEWLTESRWPEDLAELAAGAIGCHHGARCDPLKLSYLEGDRRALGNDEWKQARGFLLEALEKVFSPLIVPEKPTLSGPEFMFLSGLTSFSDWIGSNEDYFDYGSTEDCEDLDGWYRKRRVLAEEALDAIGWEPRTLLAPEQKSFEQVFGLPPRPLQKAIISSLSNLEKPSVILLEAPMGEGKTEAAFFAELELQRRFGHRGFYIALPTKATGNAMFKRTLHFLHSQNATRRLDLQLLHGAALLNDDFLRMRISGIYSPETGGEVRAGEWFSHKKRALLSEFGVGTVDQALLTILPVRHNFVRLWGLANRVVIFDEIHAYDAYTGTLLINLLRWLLSLGSSVILLSATLPPAFRRKLAEIVGASLPDKEEEYPRLSIYRLGAVNQVHFSADPARRREIKLSGIPADLPCIRRTMEDNLASVGMGLVLVNTVQRAQDLYKLFPEGKTLGYDGRRVGKILPDGTEICLFHARFPAGDRQGREDYVLRTFGVDGMRTGRKILIATQVAEQSLDLDFDIVLTDLAPIDLVLQRAGRLWRHSRGVRPVPGPILIVAGLADSEPPSFSEPLWWASVYQEDILLRTWSLLKTKKKIILPDEIDGFVQTVYEEKADAPESIRDRLEKAMIASDGERIMERSQANKAILGFPDDSSWNQPERFVLYDEDESGLHRTLLAHTRMGNDGVTAIPIWAEDSFLPEISVGSPRAKELFLRAVSISREGLAKKFRSLGIPAGWKQSVLLRNCYPMLLDPDNRWLEDESVCLDRDLGLVYGKKERE